MEGAKRTSPSTWSAARPVGVTGFGGTLGLRPHFLGAGRCAHAIPPDHRGDRRREPVAVVGGNGATTTRLSNQAVLGSARDGAFNAGHPPAPGVCQNRSMSGDIDVVALRQLIGMVAHRVVGTHKTLDADLAQFGLSCLNRSRHDWSMVFGCWSGAVGCRGCFAAVVSLLRLACAVVI
jgi:hypothetical protein